MGKGKPVEGEHDARALRGLAIRLQLAAKDLDAVASEMDRLGIKRITIDYASTYERSFDLVENFALSARKGFTKKNGRR